MDLETTPTPTPDAPDAATPAPQAKEEATAASRLKILQQACDEVRKQVAEACKTNDQPGYHAAEIWLVEAERALRKAAAQCEAAEATPTVRGEV